MHAYIWFTNRSKLISCDNKTKSYFLFKLIPNKDIFCTIIPHISSSHSSRVVYLHRYQRYPDRDCIACDNSEVEFNSKITELGEMVASTGHKVKNFLKAEILGVEDFIAFGTTIFSSLIDLEKIIYSPMSMEQNLGQETSHQLGQTDPDP